MNTRSISSAQGHWGGFCLAIAALPLITGCGYSQGSLLYMLGIGRARMVKTQFQLTRAPLLILVDDPGQRVTWPAAERYIADELAQELLRTKSAEKIVPQRTIDQLRQSQPNFDKVGCRELGKLAGAEQVLWLEIQDFFADEQFVDASEVAHIIVTVKVVNVLEEKKRSRVRLWPTLRSGTPVTAHLTGSDVARLKTTDAVSRELALQLAATIARFFHDYRPGDFER